MGFIDTSTQGAYRRQHNGHLFKYSCLTMSFLSVNRRKGNFVEAVPENSQAFYLLVCSKLHVKRSCKA